MQLRFQGIGGANRARGVPGRWTKTAKADTTLFGAPNERLASRSFNEREGQPPASSSAASCYIKRPGEIFQPQVQRC